MPVKDIDLGQKKIEALMGKEVVIKLGFIGEKAEAKHAESDKLTVVDVASFLEFGTKTAPARPMIGGYYDEKEKEIINDMNQAVLAIIDQKAGILQAFDAVGAVHVWGVQERWAKGVPPPLADATIEARRRTGRGSLSPMPTGIVTGQTRSSVTWLTQIRGR